MMRLLVLIVALVACAGCQGDDTLIGKSKKAVDRANVLVGDIQTRMDAAADLGGVQAAIRAIETDGLKCVEISTTVQGDTRKTRVRHCESETKDKKRGNDATGGA